MAIVELASIRQERVTSAFAVPAENRAKRSGPKAAGSSSPCHRRPSRAASRLWEAGRRATIRPWPYVGMLLATAEVATNRPVRRRFPRALGAPLFVLIFSLPEIAEPRRP